MESGSGETESSGVLGAGGQSGVLRAVVIDALQAVGATVRCFFAAVSAALASAKYLTERVRSQWLGARR